MLCYVPFEHVNCSASLAIVGITPGITQLQRAYAEVQCRLLAGEPDNEVLRAVKVAASFAGQMRSNLIRMLRAFPFAEILGIPDAGELWCGSSAALHATSIVPHAAFKNGKMFAGSFDEVLASDVLRCSFERDFVSSIPELGSDILYLALGKAPLDALDWCVAQGRLPAAQVLGAFPHPSGSSGSQIAIYLGEKDPAHLHRDDPVRRRVPWLLEAAHRMREATVRLSEKPNPALMNRERPTAMPLQQTSEQATTLHDVFVQAGFRATHETKKLAQYRGDVSGVQVYLDKTVRNIAVIVHPHDTDRAQSAAAEVGAFENTAYHNSNMRAFPTRTHGGNRPIPYGFRVTFDNPSALKQFLSGFDRSAG